MNVFLKKPTQLILGILIFCSFLFLLIKNSDSQFIQNFFNSKSDAPHSFTCASCHLLHNNPNTQLTSVAGNALLCMSCHNSSGMASALPFADIDMANPLAGTGSSHAWNKPAINATFETNVPLNTELAERIYSGNIVCSTCHDQHSQTYPPFLRISNAGDALCKECHSARDVGIYADDNTNHRGSHPVGILFDGADVRFLANPVSPLQLVGSNIECSSCHKLHYSTVTDGNILRVTNNNSLCTGCHTYPAHNGFSCLDCHQTHNPLKDNILMVKNTVNGSTVSFFAETGTNSFGDQTGVEDGICEVCHTTTSYYKADGSGASHNLGTNCTTCHPHGSGFAPAGCSDCHTATFPGWGTTDGHFAHTSKYTFACSTCHFNYGSGGSSEPTHPSGGTANINFNPNGLAKRNGLDSNTPSWNGTTCSNIYCHSNGRTAFRGTDGTYTWGDVIGPQPATYTTTPSWYSTVGIINSCIPCHSGIGNMNPDYKITSPFVDPTPPATGEHRRSAHVSNSQNFSGFGWVKVQCFWCHNANGALGNESNFQGTYGTTYHVDGQTRFDPRIYSDGGTMANGMTWGSEHCKTRTCW
jgi:predicted CxxxxCH...CXXCH cytochrome family protein